MTAYSKYEADTIVGIDEILNHNESEEKNYKKKDIIIRLDPDNAQCGIIRKGMACLMSISDDGEKSILDYFNSGDLFGAPFIPLSGTNLYYIMASAPCTAVLFSYKDFSCSPAVSKLTESLIRRVHMHTDILCQRTIRRKLMLYINYMARGYNKNSFSLPLSLSDLADYLAVDRSAMMRELKKLNNEHIIYSKGQNITIL